MMKAMFGDLPGHEFHGNQWTPGMHDAQAAKHDVQAKIHGSATSGSGHSDAKYYHEKAAQLHRFASLTQRRGDPPSTYAAHSIAAHNATKVANRATARVAPKVSQDAKSKFKFGRNIVREMKRTAGKAL